MFKNSNFKNYFKIKNLKFKIDSSGFLRLTKKSLVMMLIALIVFTGSGLYLLKLNNRSLKPAEPSPAVSSNPWITFIDPQQKFSVILPKEPKIEEDSYRSDNFSVNVYPAKTGQVNQLDLHVQNILKTATPSGKLIYSDHHQEASGIRYVDYKIAATDQTFKGRIFLVDKAIYELLVTFPTESFNETEFNNFLSSFQLQ